ncbi:MAG: acyl-CoA dehydrogenase, partial [Leptospiraceae bacterium]|nr:acyl-CoA dehydrogenase [Leptospiraceae bacterium]
FDKYPSVILTLARTGKPESGARGLSFFLVEGKDVFVAKIEHKMGLHCSPTCEVVYEDTPAQLIGETGQGLVKYAMEMMNTARLSIAGQSMGIAEAAYREAKKYAGEREQFGRLIQEIPAVKKMLNRMEREVVAQRALLQEAARTVDKYLWRKERLLHEGMSDRDVRKDEEVRSWEKLANFFTPLTKYYISETCNVLAFDALQIHGGSGYTEEYDVARIYRDARITNIYEGTTQLQVVAAIGGIVSGMTANGNLRAYIDGELKKFEPSAELLDVRSDFEEVVSLYKEVKGDLRDEVAFEVVQSAARFLMGLLVERSNSRVNAEAAAHRKELVKAYNLESKALLQANLIRVKNANAVAGSSAQKEPAAV